MEKGNKAGLVDNEPRYSRPALLVLMLTIVDKLREYGFEILLGEKDSLPFCMYGIYWLRIINNNCGKVMSLSEEDLMQMQKQELFQVMETLIPKLIRVVGDPKEK